MIKLGVLFALVAAATPADSFDPDLIISLRQFSQNDECNAVMISNTWAVTAASCFDGDTGSAWTVKGLFATGTAAYSVGTVNTIKIHPDYIPAGGQYSVPVNNIAVVGFQFDDSSGQIAWPTYAQWLDGTAPIVDLNAIVYGWNAAPDLTLTSAVSVTPVTLVSSDVCRITWGSVDPQFSTNTLCAIKLNQSGNLLGSNNNIGGPIVSNGAVAGVTSWGWASPVGLPVYPSVYTRTSAYLAWINSETS